MKVYFLYFSLFLLISCSVEEKPSILTQVNEKGNFCPDTSKQRLLKIIEGGWINEDYMNAFYRLNSPMAVASIGLPLQQVAFDISNLNGDTLLNAIGRMNYMEGERFDVIFYKQRDGNTGMKINENRNYILNDLILSYSIEGKDTILLIHTREGNGTHTARFHRQFRRFLPVDEIPITAMEYFVNNALFAGDWESQNKIISFTVKGQVRNFKEYKRYSISTVEQYPGSRADEISFYNDSAGVTYAFTVRNKRIQLFELDVSADGSAISRGKLLYELKKN